jgi:hypothetical protein
MDSITQSGDSSSNVSVVVGAAVGLTNTGLISIGQTNFCWQDPAYLLYSIDAFCHHHNPTNPNYRIAHTD